MKKNVLQQVAGIALLLFSSCAQDPPLVALGIEDWYYCSRMKPYTWTPALSGESYKWILTTSSGKDSLLSTERSYTFLQAVEGTYRMRLEIQDPEFPYRHEFSVVVLHEEVEYSPYISRVYEYCPAPGQFVNLLPPYEEGDTEADMRRKAEAYISGKWDEDSEADEETKGIVSLGGYGGYLTFGFDHTVVNVKGEKDFRIVGNAFYDLYGSIVTGGSAEPGIVMVAFDKNQNGIPDPDEWYELAGSEYNNPAVVKNYEITYAKPDPDKKPIPGPSLIDTEYIFWKDNQGGSGFNAKNTARTQAYYPQWMESDSLVFSGTLLPRNGVYQRGTYILHPYAWGYADNHPNKSEELNSFDIDWAVDKQGNAVYLPGVDFVRVYTGVNQDCGWIGETSTEILGAKDLHLE